MSIFLTLTEETYNDLINHLFPTTHLDEEAAFIFADVNKVKGDISLISKEVYFIKPDDFLYQSPYYFELTDAMRARIIKRAHDLKVSIVEVHSHIGQKTAQFSESDKYGFVEFVPHIFWRLKNRPYLALVFSNSDFDALVWIDDPRKPLHLEGILIKDQLLTPTNLTINNYEIFE